MNVRCRQRTANHPTWARPSLEMASPAPCRRLMSWAVTGSGVLQARGSLSLSRCGSQSLVCSVTVAQPRLCQEIWVRRPCSDLGSLSRVCLGKGQDGELGWKLWDNSQWEASSASGIAERGTWRKPCPPPLSQQDPRSVSRSLPTQKGGWEE